MMARSIVSALTVLSLIVAVPSTLGFSTDYVVGWEDPVLVETYDVASVWGVSSASDGNGNTVAVWIQSNGSGSSIYANLYDVADGWLEAELVEGTDAEVQSPIVAMNEAGNAVVAWMQTNESTSMRDIWANRYTRGVGWMGPEPVEGNGSVEDRNPNLAIDGNGKAVIVWTRYNGVTDIMTSEYETGVGWTEASAVDDSNTADAVFPSIAVDDDDNFIVVWRQQEMMEISIWASLYSATGNWGVSEKIADSGNTAYPRVAVGGGGNAMCTWDHLNDSTSFYEIWACAYDVDMGWADPVVLIKSGWMNFVDSRVAVDRDGNAVVAWWSFGGISGTEVHSRFYDTDTGWDAVTIMASGDGGDVGSPEVAMNDDGEALCTFTHYDGLVHNLRGVASNPSGGWAPSEQISGGSLGSVAGVDCTLSIDDDGSGTALWVQGDGGKSNLWSARYKALDGTPPAVAIENPDDGATFNSATVAVSGFTEPGAHLVINGIVVDVDVDGSFTCVIALLDGENTITATATDAAGNSASASVTVTSEVASDPLDDGFEEALEQLTEIIDELQSAEDEADNRVDDLSAQVMVLTALLSVFAILSIVMTVLYIGLRKRVGGSGGESVALEPPPPAE